MPDFRFEDECGGRVCGLDEAGRGPLAGPVVAACVYIPPELRLLPFVAEIRDSKKLSSIRLERLYAQICEHFVFSVAEVEVAAIDQINILQASLLAMRRACCLVAEELTIDHALVDGNKVPADMPCPARALVGGDGLSASVAAASIVAKVARDRIMRSLALEHPEYGWESNAGYPSAAHMDAIDRYGVTPHHRRSFGPVRNFLEFGRTRIAA